MNNVKPITPEEVRVVQIESIPDEVFLAFNEEIAKKYNGKIAVVKQSDVVINIHTRMGLDSIDRDTIFKKGWLNIESIYANYGWSVYYDKPGYNESYEPSFEFKRNT